MYMVIILKTLSVYLASNNILGYEIWQSKHLKEVKSCYKKKLMDVEY